VKGNKIGMLFDIKSAYIRKTKSLNTRGHSAFSDLDLMLGKFLQDRFGLGKDVKQSIEGFEMTSDADWKKTIKDYTDRYIAQVNKQRNQAKELIAMANKDSSLANKYARPIVASVFSVMNNTNWGSNSDYYTMQHQTITANSRKQLMIKVAQRIQTVANV
jgi:hypothetical protein